MYLKVCIECWIHSLCLLVPNCADLSEPLYWLWEIQNPHFENKMLESILALYRPQRNALSKAYSLPVYTKKKIYFVNLSSLQQQPESHTEGKKRHRNWGFQLNTKYVESHNKIMTVGNTIFSVLFVSQWETQRVSLKSCE